MFFVRRSKLTLFLCAGRKLLVSSMSTKVESVVVVVVEIDLIAVWGIELDMISA